MKRTLASLIALLVPSLSFAAVSFETLKVSGELKFHKAPLLFREAPPRAPAEPILQDPHLTPLGSVEPAGAVLSRVSLTELLDRHRDLITRQLGNKPWDISVAGDPGFDKYYLTFSRPGILEIRALGDLGRLRGKGIDIKIDDATSYNFKVKANIFNPTRGSTLKITALRGTSGPSHSIKTGVILDAVERKSHSFRANGKEYWLLNGTDVDPKTEKLTDTKSLLFIHMAGLSSKAWPVEEAKLENGKAYSVDLGGTKLILVKTADNHLSIRKP